MWLLQSRNLIMIRCKKTLSDKQSYRIFGNIFGMLSNLLMSCDIITYFRIILTTSFKDDVILQDTKINCYQVTLFASYIFTNLCNTYRTHILYPISIISLKIIYTKILLIVLFSKSINIFIQTKNILDDIDILVLHINAFVETVMLLCVVLCR